MDNKKKPEQQEPANPKADDNNNPKQQQLLKDTQNGDGKVMTTNQGTKVNDDNNSLKAGERGSSLLEDFILREKITHFDHERIPERIVHARGSGAHGVFELYEGQERYTKAGFLNDASRKTPVFCRFSTVAGFRGSTDLARDVRGFAVKFYTEEGIFDLVGNNMPIFFIQDAMKFPDLIHAVKPEPDNEIPQAASAHDTFYDFISLMPETMHNHIWLMSDRAIPRSYRMMEGFGIHSFRLINEAGESHFVKFHWKPLLGVHSVTWDEAVKISGQDPDFHRRDLWDAIESGDFPEWELGIQVVPQADEHKYPFDLLDPTKLIPEEIVPVQRIGKMTLNRNPDNFFAETEQVAFHPGHIVPGIDFTNDPLLQGRLFSYTDTQLIRLGGPNFHEIPINRPVNPTHNNQRDGHMRQTINKGKAAYFPNSLGGGCPFQAAIAEGGFHSFEEKVEAKKVRDRSESFSDHFSQPALFYRSLKEHEQRHVINAYSFELGMCKHDHIKSRMLGLIDNIDPTLAEEVAKNLGMPVPTDKETPMNHGVGADADRQKYEPKEVKHYLDSSKALSQTHLPGKGIKTRKIAVLMADGVSESSFTKMKKALESEGAQCMVIAPHGGKVTADSGIGISVDKSLLVAKSVQFDALYVPGGSKSIEALIKKPDAVLFVNEMFKHCKALAFEEEGTQLLDLSSVPENYSDMALLVNETPKKFINAIARHRHWPREVEVDVPV
tara:strand:- start:156635 stop:158803 length:2169 start_codon:yes stop_codon:yes gene_type:complete